MSTPLAEVLEGQHAADLRKAARALLKEPLLLAHGRHADAYRLVRRHSAELREWFARNTGWSLRCDAESARLRKTPGLLADPTHPAREATRSSAPFTRRRYVLLCLTLAALERSEAQIALGRIADQVVLEAADPHLADAGHPLHPRPPRRTARPRGRRPTPAAPGSAATRRGRRGRLRQRGR